MMTEISTYNFSLGRIFFLFSFLTSTFFTLGQLDTVHYFPPLHSRNNNQVADHYLYLSTPVSTPFDVTVTDGSGNFVTSQTISQGNPFVYQVGPNQTSGSPLFLDRPNVHTIHTNRGLIASADELFYAEVRTRGGVQAECYTGKGVNARGRTFRIGGIPQFTQPSLSTDRNFTFGILSLENNNTITLSDFDTGVTFALPAGTVTPGGMTSITLDEGETFVFTGYSDVVANLDGIIGALVQSTGDIVITNGSMNGNIHPSSGGSRDQGIDQIIPISKLGNDHIVVEGNGVAAMERPMVIAHTNNTEIYINGSAVPIATINAGDYFLIPNAEYQGAPHRNMFIRTSLPSYVYQHLAGAASEATGGMCLIPFFHCRLSNTIDLIPQVQLIGATPHTGGLLITTELGATVSINGVPQAGGVAVAGGPYETYKISGVTGNQVIESTGSVMAGIFGASGAVGYAGYYAGFADVPDSEVELVAGINSFCIGESGQIAFIGNGGIEEYNFYYTINGVPYVATNTSDTLFLPIDTSMPDVFTYVLNGIETYDLDTVNLCFYPSSSTQVIEIDPCGLPVELIDFSGYCSDGKFHVFWETASERNNEYFILYESFDGLIWNEIAVVPGAGNSSQIQNYAVSSSPSNILLNPIVYYKLIQVDYDGEKEEFSIISVNCKNENSGIIVFPNPTNGIFTIQSESKLKGVKIYNNIGQVINSFELDNSELVYKMDLSSFSVGLYFIKVELENQTTEVLKILRN